MRLVRSHAAEVLRTVTEGQHGNGVQPKRFVGTRQTTVCILFMHMMKTSPSSSRELVTQLKPVMVPFINSGRRMSIGRDASRVTTNRRHVIGDR